MKKVISIIAIFSLFGVFVLSAKTSFAKESRNVLGISPFIFNLRLSPGETYEKTMTVENILDVPLPIKLSVEDFLIQDEDGGYHFTKNESSSVLSWISLEETDFILEPKEKQEIQVTIQTPSKIPFGGYQGIIFVQPILPNQQQYSTLLNAKVGALVLANIGSQAYQIHPARILTFDMPLVTFSNENLPISFRVQNNSLYHFSAKPLLSFDPLFGEVQSHPLLEQFLFPGKVRRWTELMHLEEIRPGVYLTKLHISVGNGVQISSQKYVVYIPKWLGITLGAVVIIILLKIIIKKKPKQIAKFIRILIKGR